MFSGIYKLSEHPEEILLRIHPSKRQAFNSIVSGNATVRQNGEDVNGEPIIYQMYDGTIRVVFSSIPPRDSSSENIFDVSEFSKQFISAVQCGAVHDDREVFHVPRST
jgi:hypothetical protein